MTVRDALNQVALALVAGFGLGGLGYLVSLLYGGRIPLVACLAAGVLVGAAWQVLARLPAEDLGAPVPDEAPTARAAAGFADLRPLESLLGQAVTDQDRFDHRVRPLLTALTTDLLRQRHGLYLPAHRDRVEPLLGPHLRRLLGGQAVPASRREIEACVGELEQLAGGEPGGGR